MRPRRHPLVSAVAPLLALLACAPIARADAYDPPANYYNSATGTGATLKHNLYVLTGTNFVGRGYGDSRYYLNVLWQDPANAANTLLIYNRASVSGAWDAGITWNREHVWPKSLMELTSAQVDNAYTGIASDAFELAPANPSINTSRSDNPYGSVTSSGTYKLAGGYFFPGDADKGDAARSIFYMATRYGEGRPAGTNLTIVNGQPNTSAYQMGDLASLLKWNYTDPVDTFERRKNQYVYSSALNPTYYQGNRNPYIDHPEYVWAVFGTSANDSQLAVSTPSPDGASSTTVNLGRSIVGGTIATSSISLNKSGSTPTTFNVTTSGVTSTLAGTGRTFDYNAQSKSIDLALPAGANASAGLKSGTLTVDNTDLTTSTAGHGSTDADDTVTVTATVLDHATASFASGASVKTTTIDFGYVPAGFAQRSEFFTITNNPAPSGYTAGLDIDAASFSGSSSFTTSATPTSNLAAGASNAYTVSVNTATAGTQTGTCTFAVSDEDLPGATTGAPLQLTATARVLAQANFPVSGDLQLFAGETYHTGASSIAAGVTVTKSGPGSLVIDGPQSNGAGSTLRLTGGPASLRTDGGPNLSVAVTAFASRGTLSIGSSQNLASLSTTAGAIVAVEPGADKFVAVGSASIAAGTQLDLADNDFVITAGNTQSLASVASLLASAYDHGRWDGFGIFSSVAAADVRAATAIGFADNAALNRSDLDGRPVAPTSILLKFTWYGDANLDGLVDSTDLSRIVLDGTTWSQGDFNYDGTVNADDLALFSLGATYGSTPITLVPEPTIATLAFAALLLRRRRA